MIDAFSRDRQHRRQLLLLQQTKLNARLNSDFGLHLRFDIAAVEGCRPRRILYNLNCDPIERQIARLTLQLAFWVIEQAHGGLPIEALEYVDLCNVKIYHVTRIAPTTKRIMSTTTKVITALWASI